MMDTLAYQRNADMVEAEIDGDLVMMNVDSGQYFGLDPVAKRIWHLIEQPLSQADICADLIQRYDVSSEQCAEDVSAFLSRMMELGTVEAA